MRNNVVLRLPSLLNWCFECKTYNLVGDINCWYIIGSVKTFLGILSASRLDIQPQQPKQKQYVRMVWILPSSWSESFSKFLNVKIHYTTLD